MTGPCALPPPLPSPPPPPLPPPLALLSVRVALPPPPTDGAPAPGASSFRKNADWQSRCEQIQDRWGGVNAKNVGSGSLASQNGGGGGNVERATKCAMSKAGLKLEINIATTSPAFPALVCQSRGGGLVHRSCPYFFVMTASLLGRLRKQSAVKYIMKVEEKRRTVRRLAKKTTPRQLKGKRGGWAATTSPAGGWLHTEIERTHAGGGYVLGSGLESTYPMVRCQLTGTLTNQG